MDIYSFINSKDIAEHCRSTKHQFDAMEAAFIVNDAQCKTIKERHEAYHEIIAAMPDMAERRRHPTPPLYTSLHQALKDYMRIDEALLAAFYSETEKTAYRYGYYEMDPEDNSRVDYDDEDSLFDSPARMMAAVKSKGENKYFLNCKCLLYKKWFNSNRFIRLTTTPDGEPLRCSSRGILSEEDERFHRGLFDRMWIKLPTPFKRGDIVTAPTGWRLPPTVYEGYEGPFVLDDICYWNKGENGEYEGCDSSDMHAHGYWVDEDGMVASQFMYAYQDIEYYCGELIGDLRMLTAISNFMKGETNDYALLLNAYEVARSERHLRDSQLALNMFNDRRIGLAGLTPQRK